MSKSPSNHKCLISKIGISNGSCFLLIRILLICFVVQTVLDDLSGQVTPGECPQKWGGEGYIPTDIGMAAAIPAPTPLNSMSICISCLAKKGLLVAV